MSEPVTAAPSLPPDPVLKPNLFAALARVQAELPRIAKRETAEVENKAGQVIYSYSYADLAGVSAAILPLLGRNGLAFIARPTLNRAGNLVLAYSLTHESGEREDGEYPIRGGTPQATGSEITYARRYCLTAVTGVAPEDDDDDAAQAQQQQTRFREPPAQPNLPRDVVDGRERVKASWSVSFGWGENAATECAEFYQRWPEHKAPTLWDADATELRRYAAMLAALPPADAGSDPATVEAPGEAAELVDDAGPRATAKQKVAINAAMSKMYGTDRQARLEAVSALIGRPIKSTNELTRAEAAKLIDELGGPGTSQSSAGAQPVSDRTDAPDQSTGAGRDGEPAVPHPAAGPEAPADPPKPEEEASDA